MKRITRLFLTGFLLVTLTSFAVVGTTYTVSADSPTSEACQGVGLTDGSSCGDGGAQVGSVLLVIVNLLSIIVGIAAVIMIIIAGLRFTTSGGNPQSVAGARSALLYALVGIVIVALAQVIVHFVLTQATTAT